MFNPETGRIASTILALFIIGGCTSDEGSQLSASSTCQEYISRSSEERAEAVRRVSIELEYAEGGSPLTVAAVDSACVGAPGETIGGLIGFWAGTSLADPSASSDGPSTAATPAEPMISLQEVSFEDMDGWKYGLTARIDSVETHSELGDPGEVDVWAVFSGEVDIRNMIADRPAPLSVIDNDPRMTPPAVSIYLKWPEPFAETAASYLLRDGFVTSTTPEMMTNDPGALPQADYVIDEIPPGGTVTVPLTTLVYVNSLPEEELATFEGLMRSQPSTVTLEPTNIHWCHSTGLGGGCTWELEAPIVSFVSAQ